ncbi:MAG TPA: DUF2141 domain-containing protein [Polyangiaceae bacterium]|nr:DUF2141 domain-containing protein [Polyangiaceae bacterium]
MVRNHGAFYLAAMVFQIVRAVRRLNEIGLEVRTKRLLVFIAGVVAVTSAFLPRAGRADSARGTLVLRVSGCKHDRGKVVARIFRRSDNAPRGPGYRSTAGKIRTGKSVLEFSDLPHDTYAVFVFHDENANGIPDHNLFGLPSEPLGFSRGYRATLFSGIPSFRDLSFRFDSNTKPLVLQVD